MLPCPFCGSWKPSAKFVPPPPPPAPPRPPVHPSYLDGVPRLVDAQELDVPRIFTGFEQVDEVFGGGMVPTSAILLAGPPGIGKSTLLLQMAANVAMTGIPVFLASGEEAAGQVSKRRKRLGIPDTLRDLGFAQTDDITVACRYAEQMRARVVGIDSVSRLKLPSLDARLGSVTQVKGVTLYVNAWAKRTGAVVILLCHVNKEDDLAGPKDMEHDVDVVALYEGNRRRPPRTIVAEKNRWGAAGVVAHLAMTERGLVEREPPSEDDAAKVAEDEALRAEVCAPKERDDPSKD